MEAELPADVLAHSRFFDHLVELIPARFYYTDEEPPAPLRYMKAHDREKEKESRRALAKEAKRVKLDPERAKTTLELQREGGFRRPAPAAAGSGDEDGDELEHAAGGSGAVDGAAKMAQLRERLHSKLQVMRQERKESARKEQVRQAKEFRRASIGREQRPPRQPQHPQHPQQQQHPQQPQQQPGGKKRKQAEAGQSDASLALSFGKLEFGEDGLSSFKKPRKQGKAGLLRSAERQQAARAELSKSAEGQAQVQGAAWASALKRAKGEKVYDDPKLLRKSLKREEKQRSKSTAAWQERTALQKADQKERQKKRRDNLAARSQAKQAKKVERREKKLMRPGFEGRRDSFINGPKAS